MTTQAQEEVRTHVPPDLLRSVLRNHAKGVSVITAGEVHPVGFCATSLSSISLQPPLMSFAIGRQRSSWATVRNARHVMVHLLAENQVEVARAFAAADSDKFGPATRWHRGPYGLPTLEGVLAWMVLAPVNRLAVADHTIVIGRVVAADQGGYGRPLIHHDGDFVALATPTPL